MFFSFSFRFWWSIKFPQQNINQSETEIGDKKLSVQLYAENQMEWFFLDSMVWWELKDFISIRFLETFGNKFFKKFWNPF